jgi:hypothetical protein
MPRHIKCPDGGSLTIGETFDWENNTGHEHVIGGCSEFLTKASYLVPAQSGGTPGTVSATVRSDISPGQYGYSDGGSIMGGNPKVIVSSGPRP